jgi:MoaA/NifB/PqqE/SkfB family radical SAM enzyme
VSDGLTILWRGPLSGCNYDCGYCPFAKRRDSRATLAADRAALERFTDWAIARDRPTSILFTPWGEALIRRHYRDAITRLSHAPHIDTVAIQTNLSAPIGWIAGCDLRATAFWATYHPGETDRARFVDKIHALAAMGVRYSVGVVALREHFEAIERLRADLPPDAYLWINAEESLQGCYSDADVERLAAIDPLFELNNRAWPSRGRACAAGDSAISVSGDGTARRCHFIPTPIGNIYDPGFDALLRPSPCPQASCNCHIGYSHLKDLDLPALFGDGMVERRASRPRRDDARRTIARFAGGAA